MSTSATPSSFSSGVRQASAAASCVSTVSITSRPARFTQVTVFWAEVEEQVTTWTFTSRRVPVMPVGSPMPSWSSTTNSCGSTCRISRSIGIETALAASIARRTSSRSISAVLARDRDHAARVEAADVGAGDAHVGRADLDAGHQLGLLDHALDRVDGGLEVDDDALAQALGLGLADADDVEAALVGDLGHDRADLVGPDVEADDVAVFLLRQRLPPGQAGLLRRRGRLDGGHG